MVWPVCSTPPVSFEAIGMVQAVPEHHTTNGQAYTEPALRRPRDAIYCFMLDVCHVSPVVVAARMTGAQVGELASIRMVPASAREEECLDFCN
jgi:hypothetical protein